MALAAPALAAPRTSLSTSVRYRRRSARSVCSTYFPTTALSSTRAIGEGTSNATDSVTAVKSAGLVTGWPAAAAVAADDAAGASGTSSNFTEPRLLRPSIDCHAMSSPTMTEVLRACHDTCTPRAASVHLEMEASVASTLTDLSQGLRGGKCRDEGLSPACGRAGQPGPEGKQRQQASAPVPRCE